MVDLEYGGLVVGVGGCRGRPNIRCQRVERKALMWAFEGRQEGLMVGIEGGQEGLI